MGAPLGRAGVETRPTYDAHKGLCYGTRAALRGPAYDAHKGLYYGTRAGRGRHHTCAASHTATSPSTVGCSGSLCASW